jgi:hypothetical protein
MTDTNDKDSFLRETESLRPAIETLHGSSVRLAKFNMMAVAFPIIGFTGIVVTRNTIPLPTALFAVSFASAALVQAARWQKAKLQETFQTLWNTSDKATRNLTLGYLDETMNKKIGQTKNIIGREDFNLKDRHVRLQLGTTLVVSLSSLPLGPLMYFTGAQTRELGNAQHIEIAARHTLKFYDHIKGPKQP